jgi:threonine dehydratase
MTPELGEAITDADRRIRPLVAETRCLASADSAWNRGAVPFFKMENEQHTGSFKLRGAANKLLSLNVEDRSRGVIGASSGNHGAGLARAGAALGIRPRIFVHESADPAKIARMRALGATVVEHPGTSLEVEHLARATAEREGAIYVSPYNDLAVICGQGTIGVELRRQLRAIDAIYVSVGGGGLIAGIAAFVKSWSPATRIVGVVPDRSPVMLESIRTGAIVDIPTFPTLSDATAGGIEPGSVTFPLCQQFVDDWIAVSEEEIASAMRRFVGRYDAAIEGSAGVALAGFERRAAGHAGERVAIIICSGNIASETLETVMEGNA